MVVVLFGSVEFSTSKVYQLLDALLLRSMVFPGRRSEDSFLLFLVSSSALDGTLSPQMIAFI